MKAYLYQFLIGLYHIGRKNEQVIGRYERKEELIKKLVAGLLLLAAGIILRAYSDVIEVYDSITKATFGVIKRNGRINWLFLCIAQRFASVHSSLLLTGCTHSLG